MSCASGAAGLVAAVNAANTGGGTINLASGALGPENPNRYHWIKR